MVGTNENGPYVVRGAWRALPPPIALKQSGDADTESIGGSCKRRRFQCMNQVAHHLSYCSVSRGWPCQEIFLLGKGHMSFIMWSLAKFSLTIDSVILYLWGLVEFSQWSGFLRLVLLTVVSTMVHQSHPGFFFGSYGVLKQVQLELWGYLVNAC